MENKNQTKNMSFSFCLFSVATWKDFGPFVAAIVVTDVVMDFLQGSNVMPYFANVLKSLCCARRSRPNTWCSVLIGQATLFTTLCRRSGNYDSVEINNRSYNSLQIAVVSLVLGVLVELGHRDIFATIHLRLPLTLPVAWRRSTGKVERLILH